MGTPVSGRLRAFLPVMWKGSFAWGFLGAGCLAAGGVAGAAGAVAEVADAAVTGAPWASVRCCAAGACPGEVGTGKPTVPASRSKRIGPLANAGKPIRVP